MTPYISIDIETTGLDPINDQILEFGAVIEDWTSQIHELPTFLRLIRHTRIYGDPTAISMNAGIIKIIAENKSPLITDDFIGDFWLWLQENEYHQKNGKIHFTAAGKNFGTFDKNFLNNDDKWRHCFKVRHRVIDVGNLWWDPKEDKELPSLQQCLDRAGINETVAHTSVDDALTVVKLIRRKFA